MRGAGRPSKEDYSSELFHISEADRLYILGQCFYPIPLIKKPFNYLRKSICSSFMTSSVVEKYDFLVHALSCVQDIIDDLRRSNI